MARQPRQPNRRSRDDSGRPGRPPRAPSQPRPVKGPGGGPRPQGRRQGPTLPASIRILHKDRDLLVVTKPAHMATVANPNQPGRSLVERLRDVLEPGARHQRRDRRGGDRDKGRPTPKMAALNVLKREVSGLIVVARSRRAIEALDVPFRTGRVHRAFHAVVEGAPAPVGETLTHQASKNGKSVITHVRVIASGSGRSLVQVRPRGGWEAQVRAALSELGCPILGEQPPEGEDTSDPGRTMLHLTELGFDHPTTRRAGRFVQDPPALFWRALGLEPPASPSDDAPSDREADELLAPPPPPPLAPPPSPRQSTRPETPAETSEIARAESPSTPQREAEPTGADGAAQAEPSPAAAPAPRAERAGGPGDTSWNEVAGWYDTLLEERRSDHYDELIIPGVLRLLGPAPGERILDLACGQGIVTRAIADAQPDASVVGVDAAESLVQIARRRSAMLGDRVSFETGDARRLDPGLGEFDACICVMALMNIDPLEDVFKGIAQRLRPGGRAVLVLLHPAFRSPKRTSWGWDDAHEAQYRRVDAYLSQSASEIDMRPGAGAGADAQRTVTFHRPLGVYVSALGKAGLPVDRIEEWASRRRSEPGARSAEEDRMRSEIPLLAAIRAVHVGDGSGS